MKSIVMPRALESVIRWSLIVIVIVMPVHAFVSTWGGTAIGPMWLWKSWKEILLAALAVAAVVWLVTNRRALAIVSRQRLAWLISAYGVLVIASAGYHASTNGEEATIAGIGMDLRYLVAFALAYLVVRFGTRVHYTRLVGLTPRFLVTSAVVLTIVGVIQVFAVPLDFLTNFGYDKQLTIAPYTLIDDNPDAPRAFATLSGPNDFAAYLLLPLAVMLTYWRRSIVHVSLFILVGVGLFVSSSRSAWLGFVASLVSAAAFIQHPWLRSTKHLLGLLALAVAGIAILVALSVSVPAIRLQVFHSSPTDSSLAEGSTSAHRDATRSGIERVIAAPLGCGAGCAGPASFYSADPQISENYYVQIAEEYGVIGLILWLAIVAAVARRLWAYRQDRLSTALLMSLVGLSVIGVWLHVWADDPVALTWWIVAGSVIGYNEHKWNESKNKSRSQTLSSS